MSRTETKRSNRHVLISFVGSHDPFGGEDRSSGDGPLLSLMDTERFDVVYLLYNNDDYLRRASGVLEELQRRDDCPEVRYVQIPVSNPTEYVALYESMEHECLSIAKEHSGDELTVSTSSGTPQMQTCWLLLVLGNVFPARLVQVDPPHRVEEGESPVRRIDLAVDRFPKIKSPNRLKRELSIATRQVEKLTKERDALEREIAPNLVGGSKEFRSVVSAAKRIAKHNAPVLITGETGTGKEEIAKLVHFASDRKEEPFLPINCAGLTETLFESELFGHDKGAFTDAKESKPGLLEEAGEGTVFLDELGELPLTQQVKLLRVLNDGKYRRVGEAKQRICKARIVAATNRDLEEMVDEGTFREDLIYRLNTVELFIPPLREREDDIADIAQHFLAYFNRIHRRDMRISEQALAYLNSLPWEGNVRQLRGTIERVVLMLDDGETIQPKHLKRPTRKRKPDPPLPHISLGDEPLNLPQLMEDWERDLMQAAIARFQGNRASAARHLGYTPANFRKKAREYFGQKKDGSD